MGQNVEREDHAEPPLSRDQRRSRRHRDVRASTISVKRMSKRELELGRALYPADDDVVERPKTRADCEGIPRPCPFVMCPHHLYLDVSARTGAIKLNFPDLEPDELEESCSLDVAARDGATLEEVGSIMNLTRERIRQIEVRALAKLAATGDAFALRDFVAPMGVVLGARLGPQGQVRGKRRLPVLGQLDEADDDDDVPAPKESGTFDVDRFASDELDSEYPPRG